MKIIVTTFPGYAHLIEKFGLLMKKFWGAEYEVDIAKPGEKSSTQLKRIAETIKDEFFILLKEDFYLLKKVDLEFLRECWDFATFVGADRFGLQSVNDYQNIRAEEFGTLYDGKVYKFLPSEPYLCSLEASIWRRDFLRKHIFVGGSDRDIELNMSHNVRGECNIFVPEKRVLNYADAMRGGEERIRLEGNKLFLLTGNGWEEKLEL